MPEKRTIQRARKDKRAGKAPTTQAGEFVREEIHKIRRGKHGARSPEQAIAIGLSEARRAGVDLPPPEKGKAKASTRKSAKYAYEAGQGKRKTPAPCFARGLGGVAARTAEHGIQEGSLTTCQARRFAPHRLGALRRSAKSRSNERRQGPFRRG